jgi:hypothetical protein
MNCKPGDLAIIVKETIERSYQGLAYKWKYRLGTVVKVIKIASAPGGMGDGWQIEQPLPIELQIFGFKGVLYEAYWCPDEILKPLRGFEDDDSINFSIDKHQEVTA